MKYIDFRNDSTRLKFSGTYAGFFELNLSYELKFSKIAWTF